ncbi:MAG TPA: 4-hydroxy-3-methylbut-2-enyl diphosphate reductase [Spirochaetota bacterium]|nr:4-hydroxy-3-methylbut-2-enyl diphosphate reductase [Spirochaetota bacterium]HQH97841.1 4-hydroxy-3-methylbut-2-enyl diphosphate reductase [Spirochaetota bacterium]
MKLRSYAKINLTLDILGKRDDGYHELESVFQQVNLFDDIIIQPREDGAIHVTATSDEIAGRNNICYGAALRLKEETGLTQGVDIGITKRIPMGAGLGGGSSNAAAVLKGMNHLFRLGLDREELSRIGGAIGMDVPFHLQGGTCIGRGRGEIIEPLKPLPKLYLVIVYPGFSISTKEAYGTLRYDRTGTTRSTSAFRRDYDLRHIHNDFEYSIIDRYPEIGAIKKSLGNHALLSGSGSCVFGIYQDPDEAKRYYELMRHTYESVFITETINKKIFFADAMGFCGGVKRALDGISQLGTGGTIQVLGNLVHNEQVTRRLREQGVRFISDHKAAENGTVVISAHGVSDSTQKELGDRGLPVVDLTCPVVKSLQEITKQKEREGKTIIILGDAEHPEIRGVTGNLSRFRVVRGAEEITGADLPAGAFIASQTTMDTAHYDQFKETMRALRSDIEAADSVCHATRKRQSSAQDLAGRSDLVLVIGGSISANTKRLLDVCRRSTRALQIESDEELDPEWFADCERIGITAGASTPDWVIESVESRLRLLL